MQLDLFAGLSPGSICISRRSSGRLGRIYSAGFAAFVFSVVTPLAGLAAVDVQYKQPLSLDFDSNPLMASRNESSVWKFTTSPSIDITKTDGVDTLYGNAVLRVARSSDKMLVIDREDPTLNVRWTRELERWGVSVDGHYDEMSTRDSQLDDTGDVVVKEETRKLKSLGANWHRALTERLTLNLGGKLTSTKYSSPAQVNQINRSLNASLGYAWTERFQSSVNLSRSHQDPDRGVATNLLTAGLGFNWLLTERLTLKANGGMRKLTAESGGATVGGPNSGASGSGWNADGTVSYVLDRMSYNLNLMRSTEPSSSGGFKEKDRLKAGFTYALSEKSRLGVDFAFNRIYSGNAGSGSQSKNENQNFNAWVSRELSPNWGAKLQYQKKDQDNNGVKADANIIGVSLTFTGDH